MSDERFYIGVDLGGTNIASAVVSDAGALSGKSSIPTPRGCNEIADAIARCCRMSMRAAGISCGDVVSVGVGVPGTVDGHGNVLFACNIDMRSFPLAEALSSRLGLPVTLDNDANCAAAGEYLAGCGRGCSSLLCLTIGTGIGGGFVSNGRIFRGFNGCAPEVGHMVIDFGGRRCACSRRGCFETLASASALERMTREYIAEQPDSICAAIAAGRGRVDGRTIFAAMDSGDAGARDVFRRYAEYLACGVTNLVNIFQPELVCLGGGISAQGERLIAPVRGIVEAEDYARVGARRTKIVCASLGNDAGITGAALMGRLNGGNT